MKIFNHSISGTILFSSLVASLGSILFGYASAVISGALLFIADEFHLSYWQQGVLVSSLVFGAILGAAISGIFADKFGRKAGLFLVSILFLLATVLIIFFDLFSIMVLGRALQGIAVGGVSVIVPLYLSEIAPIKYRGAIVSLSELAIVFGVTLSYFANYTFSFSSSWRYMFAFALIPTALFLIGIFFVAKSPIYLFSRKEKNIPEKGLKILNRDALDEKNLAQEEATRQKHYFKTSSETLFNKENKPAFIVGIGISIFQQITGINIVIYYAPKIFNLSKFFDAESAIFVTAGLGILMFLMTLVALFIVDKIGRRKLLFVGSIGMGLSMFFLGMAINFPNGGMYSVLAMMLYLTFYAISLGPIAWLLISEIFALPIRGRAMGIAALSNWTANYLVSLTFLPLVSMIGLSKTFYMFALICFGAYYFIRRRVPETKNKSFEEIQNFWKNQ